MMGGRSKGMSKRSFAKAHSTNSTQPQHDIRLIDLQAFARLVAERLEQQLSEAGTPASAASFQEEVQQVILRAADAADAEVVQDAKALPYKGMKEQGNPITFLLSHYRLQLEKGRYFQSDLAHEDEKLWNALRNVFKSKFWRHYLQEAITQLRAEGRTTVVAGRDLTTVTELRDILPARTEHASRKRNLEPV